MASRVENSELLLLERTLGFLILYTTYGRAGLLELGFSDVTLRRRKRECRRVFGVGVDEPGALLKVQMESFRLLGHALPGADVFDEDDE